MTKKIFLALCAPMLLAGCASNASFTNLTPTRQSRNSKNLYTVEVAMRSSQQTLRWDTIQPRIVVGNEYYQMHTTPMMKNRWEGSIPVPPDVSEVHYHYKFDYLYNSFGSPKSDSASSREYMLKIVEK